MRVRQLNRIVFLGLLALLLSACALSLKQSESRFSSDDMLAQQLARVERALEQAPGGERRVLFVGSAQHSQSLAFQGDVLLVQKSCKRSIPRWKALF